MSIQLKSAQAASTTQELCESRGGHSELPVPNKPDGFCGGKATLDRKGCKELGKQENDAGIEHRHIIDI